MIYVIDHNDSFTHNVVHQFSLFDEVECDNYNEINNTKLQKAKVLVLIPFFIFFTVKVPAYILLIFWFLYQFLNLSNVDSSVAWLAHIGGFIFGYFFAVFSKSYNVGGKGKTVLLDKDEKGPWD